MEVIALFIPILAVVGIVIMVIYLRKFTNDERMAMIDKGISVEDWPVNRKSNASWALRIALMFIGVGLGILTGALVANNLSDDQQPVAYFSTFFIGGGLGLAISYFIEEKKNKTLNN